MKLRNKKTDEVKEVIVGGYPVTGKTKMWECDETDCNSMEGYRLLGTYETLAELNEEWEDYDDTKDHWCISFSGEAKQICKYADSDDIVQCKEIGNYFETKEEAETALEVLKIWKRLKDKGTILKFHKHNRTITIERKEDKLLEGDDYYQWISDANRLIGDICEINQ
jgi:hypothetical protein